MEQKDLQNIGEQVVKKKRTRPDKDVQLEEGDSSKFLKCSLRLYNLPEIEMSNPEQVKNRVQEYFTICCEEDTKPSVAGLALALNIDRRYLWELREGKKGKSQEVADTLKKAMKLLDVQMTDYMQNGKINPVAGIFLMKNNFGYADKQEIEVKAQSPLGDTNDTKELEDRYKDSVIIEEDGTTVINE